ncbi:MAG: cytidine deaminase [Pseudomonadota bacterium]
MDQELMQAAAEMRSRAYAPYSKFQVGAALRDTDGRIHLGCNVENAAYPQGQCAEATAIGAMVAAGGQAIAAIAISGPDGAPCAPCGGCRQRIREFAAPDTPVLLCDSSGLLEAHTLESLLPASFGPENLR